MAQFERPKYMDRQSFIRGTGSEGGLSKNRYGVKSQRSGMLILASIKMVKCGKLVFFNEWRIFFYSPLLLTGRMKFMD